MIRKEKACQDIRMGVRNVAYWLLLVAIKCLFECKRKSFLFMRHASGNIVLRFLALEILVVLFYFL